MSTELMGARPMSAPKPREEPGLMSAAQPPGKRWMSAAGFTVRMTDLKRSFGKLCRQTRLGLDVSQASLAPAAGVSPAYISQLEAGLANPTLDVVENVSAALGMDLEFVARPPIVLTSRQRDLVHARCSGYVHRRLLRNGLACLREVEVVERRTHGWIDILAFDPRTGMLLVIEIKTTLDDIGAVERQLDWYTRAGPSIAMARGWRVRAVRSWLLVLASDEVEAAIRTNRQVLRVAFPDRAIAMRADLAGTHVPGIAGRAGVIGRGGAVGPAGAAEVAQGRGLALIDPASRRREWLLSSSVDGRRSPAPYRDYAAAAARFRAG